jgi:hypothetical protein
MILSDGTDYVAGCGIIVVRQLALLSNVALSRGQGMNKKRKIKEQLGMIETCLANAEEYLARGLNVESSGWLHLDDWNGKSGHPLWMKNFMIPVTEKARDEKEKALEKINRKERDKRLKRRKQVRNVP